MKRNEPVKKFIDKIKILKKIYFLEENKVEYSCKYKGDYSRDGSILFAIDYSKKTVFYYYNLNFRLKYVLKITKKEFYKFLQKKFLLPNETLNFQIKNALESKPIKMRKNSPTWLKELHEFCQREDLIITKYNGNVKVTAKNKSDLLESSEEQKNK